MHLIAENVGEVRLITGITREMWVRATRAGVNDFRYSDVSARDIGVDKVVPKVIWRMCKPDYTGPLAVPHVIEGNLHNWHAIADPRGDGRDDPRMLRFEERSFYVDFGLGTPH